MDKLGIIAVPTITAVCLAFGIIWKAAKGTNNQIIPALVLVLGMALGVIAHYTIPGFPAKDWLEALAVGAVSGWAATGLYETYRNAKEGLNNGTEWH